MNVLIYSHHFVVTGYDRNGYNLLSQYALRSFAEYDERAMRLMRWNGGSTKPIIKKIYATTTKNRKEYRFHIHTLDAFKQWLNTTPYGASTTYETVPLYEPKHFNVERNPIYIPREDQEPYVDYILAPGVTKILNLPTGFGKLNPYLRKCSPRMAGRPWVRFR